MWRELQKQLESYCGATSIHGFAYLPKTEASVRWYERLFWGFALGGFLSWASFIIYTAFDDWARNPMSSSTDFNAVLVNTIQFPTVTVCSKNDYDRWAPLRLLYNSVQYECEVKTSSSPSNSWAAWKDTKGHEQSWGLQIADTDCSGSQKFKAEVHPNFHREWFNRYLFEAVRVNQVGVPEISYWAYPILFLLLLPYYELVFFHNKGFAAPEVIFTGYGEISDKVEEYVYNRLQGVPQVLLDFNETLAQFKFGNGPCGLSSEIPSKVREWYCDHFIECIHAFAVPDANKSAESASKICKDMINDLFPPHILSKLKTLYTFLDLFQHFDSLKNDYAVGREVSSNFGTLLQAIRRNELSDVETTSNLVSIFQHFSDGLIPELLSRLLSDFSSKMFFDKELGSSQFGIINEKSYHMVPFIYLVDQIDTWNYTEEVLNRFLEQPDTGISIVDAIELLVAYDEVPLGRQLNTYTVAKQLIRGIRNLSETEFPSVKCFRDEIDPDIFNVALDSLDKFKDRGSVECEKFYLHNAARFKTFEGDYDYEFQHFKEQLDQATCVEYVSFLTLNEVESSIITGLCQTLQQDSLGVLEKSFNQTIKLARYSFVLGNSMPSPALFDQHWSEATIKALIGDYNLKDRAVLPDRELDAVGFQSPMSYWEQDLSKMELIFQCSLQDEHQNSRNCRNEFTHVPTNMGICSAFNAVALSKLVHPKRVPAYETFNDLFNFGTRGLKDLIKNVGYGSAYGMTLVLDKHYLERDIPTPEDAYFNIAITSGDSYMNVASLGVEAFPGHETLLSLTVEQHLATAKFRGFDIMRRKCRFKNELPSKEDYRFREYSKESCLFECGQKLASSHCACVPWDMPLAFQDTKVPNFCNARGTECFKAMLVNVTALDQCPCESNCEELQFSVKMNSKLFNTGPFCRKFTDEPLRGLSSFEDGLYFRLKRYFGPMPLTYQARENENLIRGSVFRGDPVVQEALCVEKVQQNLALIRVEMASPSIENVVTKDSRTYYFEQLGVLGGPVGLFTGVSLLSLVEIGYWIYLTIRVLIVSGRQKKADNNEEIALEDGAFNEQILEMPPETQKDSDEAPEPPKPASEQDIKRGIERRGS